MSSKKQNLYSRLWQALLGGEPEPQALPVPETQLQAEIAALRMELTERDKRIETMQKEYSLLTVSRDKGIAGAGQEEMERLFKKVAGPLSNLAALTGLKEAGQEVSIDDVIQLFHDLEKELAKFGLQRIGQVGENSNFDTTLHQRMSGGTVHNGSLVVVRIPGYKIGNKILCKAMISTREA